MKTISEHIKKKEFSSVYLIFGEEEYLKKQYRDDLKKAIVSEDTMNYSYFEGKSTDVNEIISIGDTMPFFADHRLIVLENTGFLKSSNDALAEYVKNLPEYLIIIFVEKELDKRNKLYKAISSVGYVTEMKPQGASVLKKWIVTVLGRDNMKITGDACELLLDKTGASMDLIQTELEKLISYCQGKEGITVKDVEAIVSSQTVNKIFDMIDSLAMKKQAQALNLYYDLLELKEPPMRILYLIARQFNCILQAKELSERGMSNKEIVEVMGGQPWLVGKYVKQANYFTYDDLNSALKTCAENEELVKTGRIGDKLAVELVLVKYSK